MEGKRGGKKKSEGKRTKNDTRYGMRRRLNQKKKSGSKAGEEGENDRKGGIIT